MQRKIQSEKGRSKQKNVRCKERKYKDWKKPTKNQPEEKDWTKSSVCKKRIGPTQNNDLESTNKDVQESTLWPR